MSPCPAMVSTLIAVAIGADRHGRVCAGTARAGASLPVGGRPGMRSMRSAEDGKWGLVRNRLRSKTGASRPRWGRASWLVAVAMVAVVGCSLATPAVAAQRRPPEPAGLPEVVWPQWPQWSVWTRQHNLDYADEYTLFNLYTPSSLDGEQSRQDRCRVGLVLHQGGPQVRALAQSALESSDAERRRVLAGGSARESPLGVAAARDWDASPPPPVFESEQEKRWLTAINKFDHLGLGAGL